MPQPVLDKIIIGADNVKTEIGKNNDLIKFIFLIYKNYIKNNYQSKYSYCTTTTCQD
jgi:hypothetical protein